MPTTSPCTRVLCTRERLVLTLALSLGFALTGHAQNNAVSFTDSQPIPLAANPNPQLPADGAACSNLFEGQFHRGGVEDLVSTCSPGFPVGTASSTAVLLNQVNGTYKTVEDTSLESASYVPILAVPLVNNVGLSDLVVIPSPQTGGSGFGVQFSNTAGNGTFGQTLYYTPSGVPAGSQVVAVVYGIFDRNTYFDLAVLTTWSSGSTGGANLTIFLNDGTGKLTQTANYPFNGTNPLLAIGDINGDGLDDLAVVFSNAKGTAIPFISQGNGKFTEGATYSVGTNPRAAVLDRFNLNNDNYADLVVTTSTGINILFGTGSGTFSGSKFTSYPTPVPPFGAGAFVTSADLDQDGKFDLALTTPTDVYVFWGDGTGSFTSSAAYSVAIPPVALVHTVSRFDGPLDLAIASQDGSISVLLNLRNRVFRAATNTHSPNSAGIVAADFNGDGKKDVAVVNVPTCKAPCDGTVSVFPGAGTYFSAGKTYTIGMHGQAIAAGDINGDGVLDLVVTNATSGDNADTSILIGIKGGGFQPARNITLGSLSNDAFLVDVNGDGKLDLVEDGGVALGDGKGTFGSLTPFPDGIAFGPWTNGYPAFSTHLAIGDFNGDNHPDVVALFSQIGQQQADLLINNGKGDFTATPLNGFSDMVQSGNGVGVLSVTAGPLKPGGPTDIVFSGAGGAPDEAYVGAFIFTNDGKGNFQWQTTGPTAGVPVFGGEYASPVTIADFNHDGYPDIGFGLENIFFVSTGPNFSSPRLPFATTFGALTNPNPGANFAVADFNNDGWPDVAFSNPYGISRLYNVPVPTVTPASLTFTSAGAQKVTVKNTLKTSESITVGLMFLGTAPAGGASPFSISSNTCKALAAGASCSITVGYTGSTTASATLYVSSDEQFIDAVPISAN